MSVCSKYCDVQICGKLADLLHEILSGSLTLVDVVVKEPDLSRNVLTGRHVEDIHRVALASIEALFGIFVNDFSFFCVGPLLVVSLAPTRGHFNLNRTFV